MKERLIQGLKGPIALAVSGNTLFVVNSGYTAPGAGGVGKYNANNGDVINANLITGLMYPDGLALSGNTLFVAIHASGLGSVGEYNATTGTVIKASFIAGLLSPFGLALDLRGIAETLSATTISGAPNSALWIIQWELSEISPIGGYIIQHIKGASTMTPPGGTTILYPPYEYREAWRIAAGTKKGSYDKWSDTLDFGPIGAHEGNSTWGSATFYEGLTRLPSTFKIDTSGPTGDLPVSYTDPTPLLAPYLYTTAPVVRTSTYGWIRH